MHGVIRWRRCYQMKNPGSICFARSDSQPSHRTGRSRNHSNSDRSSCNPMCSQTRPIQSIAFKPLSIKIRSNMKTFLARVLPILFLCVSASAVTAGDFESAILSPSSLTLQINVPADRFLIIRNFTQEGGSTRGFVTVNTTSGKANVLTAAIVDPTNTTPLEVINNVVVAGPAGVTVTCPSDATDCFISYRKGSD